MRTRWRLPEIDVPLALASAGLLAIGLATVYSATSIPGAHEGLWLKQLGWLGFALAAAVLVAAIPYRVYDALAWPLYGVSIVLLVLVLVMGSSAMGAKRWLEFGPVRFQPSEIAKLATVFVLARRLDDRQLDLSRFSHWFPPLLVALVPFALVAKQPDLGTSLSFPAILLALYVWAGMPGRQLVLGLTPVFNAVLFFATHRPLWFAPILGLLLLLIRPRVWVLVVVVGLNLGLGLALPRVWNHLHDYQRRRIETFLDPGRDPYGAGYQIIQSKIAIGSGGVRGKGYLRGTQKALAFLPMRHTDFIFSVVGEELGFAGALIVVILYAVVILRGLKLGASARDGFASLLAVGVTTALFFHIMVNMLMTIGWAPVTGLPLPLLSYGGTALVVNCMQIGLLQNVALRRRGN